MGDRIQNHNIDDQTRHEHADDLVRYAGRVCIELLDVAQSARHNDAGVKEVARARQRLQQAEAALECVEKTQDDSP